MQGKDMKNDTRLNGRKWDDKKRKISPSTIQKPLIHWEMEKVTHVNSAEKDPQGEKWNMWKKSASRTGLGMLIYDKE